MKLRPIVAGPSCHRHRLSNLLDILLRPYTKHVTSYLRDTADFLNNLPTTLPTNTILASFDTESLYSNIPHDLGIEAVNYWIDKYPDTRHSRFSKDFILDGMKLILENNILCFNDSYFKQEKGTAMGTKFAPVYATLTIGYLEEKLYDCIKTSYDTEFYNYFKKGTAMGTKFSPVYATLTFGHLEEKLYDCIETNNDTEFYNYFKLYWKRLLHPLDQI